jgi:TRAP-type C4-dicarboxylate transport system substrate-binding protein
MIKLTTHKTNLIMLVIGYLIVIGPLIMLEGSDTFAEENNLPKLEMRLTTVVPAASPAYKPMNEWPASMIEKVTNGRIKVTIFPGGSIAPPTNEYRAVQSGIADMGWPYAPYTPGAFPVSNVFTLPGLFEGNMATSNLVLNMLYEKYPAFKNEISPKVKHLASTVMLRADIHSRIPIRTLADLRGKVFGCQDEVTAKALSKFGASTSVIPIAEMYTSGERGVVQGVVVAWGAYTAWRLNEVYKYHTRISMSPGVSHWMINKKFWNRLTQEEQKKIELLAPCFQRATIQGAGMVAGIGRLKLSSKEKGHVFFELSGKDWGQLRKTLRPMWAEWAEKMEAKGIPGNEILKEALRLLNIYGWQFG